MQHAFVPPFYPSLLQVDEHFVVDQHDRREDLSVQVKLTRQGRWHRKAVGGLTTACGEPLNGHATRDEQYGPRALDMCDQGCFTAFELARIPTPAAGTAPDPAASRPHVARSTRRVARGDDSDSNSDSGNGGGRPK